MRNVERVIHGRTGCIRFKKFISDEERDGDRECHEAKNTIHFSLRRWRRSLSFTIKRFVILHQVKRTFVFIHLALSRILLLGCSDSDGGRDPGKLHAIPHSGVFTITTGQTRR